MNILHWNIPTKYIIVSFPPLHAFLPSTFVIIDEMNPKLSFPSLLFFNTTVDFTTIVGVTTVVVITTIVVVDTTIVVIAAIVVVVVASMYPLLSLPLLPCLPSFLPFLTCCRSFLPSVLPSILLSFHPSFPHSFASFLYFLDADLIFESPRVVQALAEAKVRRREQKRKGGRVE